jgi:hypothetical protein
MGEVENLRTLRDKLVARRRTLVASLLRAAPEQLTGDAILRIQTAIESVERAIEEERHVTSIERRSG